MIAADVCSYLRGRLQMRVTALDDGRYVLAPLPRDVGNGKWEPEVWDLKELCEQYKIPLDRVGLSDLVGRRFEFSRTDDGELVPVRELPSATWQHADGSIVPAELPVAIADLAALLPCTADQRPCLELDEVDGYVFCTREAGHLEDHAAHDSTGAVVRQWPRKTPP